MSFISRAKDFFGLATRPVGDIPHRRASSEYMRGGRGPTYAAWRPPYREAYQDILPAWQDAAARATDIIHNSGWISGAIDQAVADTVGTGLRLNAMPDPAALGVADEKAAAAWARETERQFNIWAEEKNECDIEARRTFGQMQAAIFRMWFATGEILAEIPWKRRPGRKYGTKMRIIPPFRLALKTVQMERIIQGIRMDQDAMPLGYIFRTQDPWGVWVDTEVIARDGQGRPNIIHAFDGVAGQYRGITPLVNALKVARNCDQLADATLMSSIVQSVFAATITADAPTDEVLEGMFTPQERARMLSEGVAPIDAWFEMQAGWNDRANLDVGINGRISHLFPGQELEFHGSKMPSTHYKDFHLHLLRELARCIGVTYEGMTGDYEGVTFSSIRMASGSNFNIVKNRRQFLIAPFCQGGYEAFVEEGVDRGDIVLPGGPAQFAANRTAICRARWLGTPKLQPDDGKTAVAQQTWQHMGVMSDGMICDDLGVDVEDVYAQRAREMEMRKTLKLPEPAPPPNTKAIADGSGDSGPPAGNGGGG